MTLRLIAPAPVDPGFTAQIAYGDTSFRDIVENETIQVVAPAPIRVKVDGFVGFPDNDPRKIDVQVDFGERYTLVSHSEPEIPPELLLYDKSVCGLEDGLICDHAMRGTDMSGTQLLTADYTGGAGPTGTIDQTITITAKYGGETVTKSCKVRLIHREVYYLDGDKTLAPDAAETRRWGLIYVSTDGVFTGAPAEQAPNSTSTPTVGGIAHMQLSTFSKSSFTKAAITAGNQSGHNWGGSGYPECVAILFKAGETFYTNSVNQSIEDYGANHTWGTWTHAGSTANARIETIGGSTYDPSPVEIFKNNAVSGLPMTGWRIVDLDWILSDYDPTVQASREWWNILKYSGKTGTIAVNTEPASGRNGLNGDILSNGDVSCEVIHDDGVDTLFVRQIMNVSAATGATLRDKLYDSGAVEATYTDGLTLTNEGATGSVTFELTGSRQDRVPKTPNIGFSFVDNGGVLFDRCRIVGAASGIIGLGTDCVVSDTVVGPYWNYGVTKTAGGSESNFGEKGTVIVLPDNPTGDAQLTRTFGAGEAQADNRNFFSCTYSAAGQESTPALNLPSHTARRMARFGEYSQARCITHTYGGHGGIHQPQLRGSTDGTNAEGSMAAQFSNNAYQGGDVMLQFNSIGEPPYTPAWLRIEKNFFVSDFCSSCLPVKITFSNFRFFNNVIDYRAEDVVNPTSIGFVTGVGDGPFDPDPDVGAVQPILDFNTFIFRATNTSGEDVLAEEASHRGVTWNWSDNAYAIVPGTVQSIPEGIGGINDDPATDYNSDWNPNSGANAYQSATGTAPDEDIEGTSRPATNVSKGALEPV